MKIKIKGNQLEEIEGLTSEYPYVLHQENLMETKVPWHWHEELEFGYVSSGRVKVITANSSYQFRKSEAFFINTNVLCTMEGMEDDEEPVLDSHLFHPVLISGHFKSIFETKYLEPILKSTKVDLLEIRGENRGQRQILTKLRSLARIQKKPDTEFQTRNILSEIWMLLLGEVQEAEKGRMPVRQVNQERMQTMIAFIHENYQRKITLEEIALSASVGKRECLRCFQNCIHKTPFEYLTDYRIEAAKKMLRSTSSPVIQIALQTGFANEAYFCKVFKKACGKTPGSYRKEHSG